MKGLLTEVWGWLKSIPAEEPLAFMAILISSISVWYVGRTYILNRDRLEHEKTLAEKRDRERSLDARSDLIEKLIEQYERHCSILKELENREYELSVLHIPPESTSHSGSREDHISRVRKLINDKNEIKEVIDRLMTDVGRSIIALNVFIDSRPEFGNLEEIKRAVENVRIASGGHESEIAGLKTQLAKALENSDILWGRVSHQTKPF